MWVKKSLPILFAVGVLYLFCFLALHNFISHSEFWSITASKGFGSLHSDNLHIYYKSLFYFLLSLIFQFDLTNIEHIQTARLLFGLLAFFNFALIIKNIHLITKSDRQAWIFSFFLLSFHIFTYRIFRVRADLLASSFVLLAYTRINLEYTKRLIKKSWDPVLFTFFSLAFLSTPKSFYMIFMMLIYRGYLLKDSHSKAVMLKFGGLYLLLPAGVLLVISGLAYELELVVEGPYTLAFEYYINSLKNIGSVDHWSEVISSLAANFIHYLIICFGFFLLYKKRTELSPLFFAQGLLAIMAILIIAIHPEHQGYFIAQYIPFVSLPLLFVLNEKTNKKVLSFALVIGFCTPLVLIHPKSWYLSNKEQFRAISQLEEITDYVSNATYFDSMGLLPRKNAQMWFLGPNDPRGRQLASKLVRDTKPDFIFYTPKVSLVNQELLSLLHSDYQQLNPSIYVNRDQRWYIVESSFREHIYLLQHFGYDGRVLWRFSSHIETRLLSTKE